MTSELHALRQAFASRNWPLTSQLCQKILTADPQQVDAHMVMGLMAGQHGHLGAALRAFETVVKLDSSRLDARIQLARCLVHKGEHGLARQQADWILHSAACHTLSATLLDLLATVYSHIGLQETALTLYERCLEMSPDSVPYLSNTAGCLIFLGHRQRAKNYLLHALELQPNYPKAHWQLARLEPANANVVSTLQTALEKCPDTDPQGQIFLHYSLGKAFEDLRQWDKAWQHFHGGAKAQRQRLNYNPASDRQLFQSLRHTFDSSWFSSLSNDGATQQNLASTGPVFVVGLPRSGTTLVERIITNHSGVQSLGELPHIPIQTKRLAALQSGDLLSVEVLEAVAHQNLKPLAEHYYQAIHYLRNDQPRFVDKLPHNSLYIGLLAKAFPEAQFVCLQREPMDNCWALYKQLFAGAYFYSYELEELGSYVQQHRELMAHWQRHLPERFHTIDYETLVTEQEDTTRGLLNFLQLEFEPECLAFESNRTAAATASAAQVRSKIHSRSVGGWCHYEKQLATLKKYFYEQ
ncbi:hypothetical protein G8770_09145 [Aestuariicella hydrocarbonica]|uniref:Sulfotransferase family protein n=1 Tax=Pseudomaricurvus hydrocarbonicus TaxID=1470433 RepID=A0A9E5MHA5_9GAMM|nr:sulfotransferase [Aestuariicella hydrocarbonica]NHO65706.1 hypothetical protein [Aestuariicella hydrocarbonica]